jgi:hypothetical protein
MKLVWLTAAVQSIQAVVDCHAASVMLAKASRQASTADVPRDSSTRDSARVTSMRYRLTI